METDVRRRNVLNELLIVRSYFQSWRCDCDCLPLSQRVPEHIKTGKISISWAVSCFQIRKTLAHRVERILVEPTNSLIGVRKKMFYLIDSAAAFAIRYFNEKIVKQPIVKCLTKRWDIHFHPGHSRNGWRCYHCHRAHISAYYSSSKFLCAWWISAICGKKSVILSTAEQSDNHRIRRVWIGGTSITLNTSFFGFVTWDSSILGILTLTVKNSLKQ